MNIGTNTGAISAHLAEAEPMKRLMNAVSRMKSTNSGKADRPSALRDSAPLTAMIRPSCVQLKNATNCAAKNTSTR